MNRKGYFVPQYIIGLALACLGALSLWTIMLNDMENCEKCEARSWKCPDHENEDDLTE